MNTRICLFVLLLKVATLFQACAASTADHPLSWLDDVGKSHRRLCSAIDQACRVPGFRTPARQLDAGELSGLYLDMRRCFRTAGIARFQERAYGVLDDVMRRQRVLDEAWTASRLSDRQDAESINLQAAYLCLRYRMKIAEALTKLAISQQMADLGSQSYCIQSMESSIDCLQSAAESVTRYTVIKGRSALRDVDDLDVTMVRKLRESLLKAWDRSKGEDSLAPIASLDVASVVHESVEACSDGKSTTFAKRIFGWLR